MTTQLNVYVIACLFFLGNATGFRKVLIGLSLVGFWCGGYLAMMPTFTPGCYGARNVGANYGIVFAAWEFSALVFTKVFAGILKTAKEAGNLAAGYNKACFTLAVFCVVGIVLVLSVKRPIHEVGPSGGTEQEETRVT